MQTWTWKSSKKIVKNINIKKLILIPGHHHYIPNTPVVSNEVITVTLQ
jgi:hypothetical protein